MIYAITLSRALNDVLLWVGVMEGLSLSLMNIKAKVVNLSLIDALSLCIVNSRFEYRSLIRVSASNHFLYSLFVCCIVSIYHCSGVNQASSDDMRESK